MLKRQLIQILNQDKHYDIFNTQYSTCLLDVKVPVRFVLAGQVSPLTIFNVYTLTGIHIIYSYNIKHF